MTTENRIMQTPGEMWATVELMDHGQTAGRIEKPTEWGGLLRVDVPDEKGGFSTEFYGISAIYRIKFVSEEIARAYAPRERDIQAYDTPIVTRDQHEAAIMRLENKNHELRQHVNELERRLTQIRALPEPGKALPESSDEFDVPF